MEVYNGAVLQVLLTDTPVYWRISAIDRKVVKLFEEDGRYRQIPYENLMEMLRGGYVKIVDPAE